MKGTNDMKPTTKYSILEKYFGHSSFRGGQELLIDAILSGHMEISFTNLELLPD